MKLAVVLACTLAVVACGKKKDDIGTTTTSSGSAPAAPVAPPPPTTGTPCPTAGDALKDGKCVTAVTAESVAAIGTQASRLDELAKALDKVEAVAAPIELLDAIIKLPEWQALEKKVEKLHKVDEVVAALRDGVGQLKALKGSLGEASQRLGNLEGELDKLMHDTGAAQKLEDVKAKVSTQLRGALEPLALQTATTLQKAFGEITTQLTDTGDLVIGACAMAKISGGSKDLTALCDRTKQVFNLATTALADLKAKPGALYAEVSGQLELRLQALVDEATKAALSAAQSKVDEALKLPPAGSGSGSGSTK